MIWTMICKHTCNVTLFKKKEYLKDSCKHISEKLEIESVKSIKPGPNPFHSFSPLLKNI